MRRHISLRACIANLLLLAGSVDCIPELAFPVNAQLPPVAYSSELYTYTFGEATFRTNKPPLFYSIEGGPSWLSIDSSSRTLQGSPGQADVGAVAFQLVVADEDGRTATGVTLIVADQKPLSAGKPVDEALRSAGQIQEPSSLLLGPLAPFTISFPQDIFSGTSSSSTFYAVSSDNSPLPSWIQFDAQALRLSGITPTIVNSSAQQQSYGFKIVASNIPGFAEASVAFAIVIARSLFLFQLASTTVNVTRGQEFRSERFRNILYLDGQPISSADLESVQADLPQWVNLDTDTITLSGLVPDNFSRETFIVRAQDRFGDQAALAVVLQSSSSSGSANTLNITAYSGEYLNFILPQSLTQNATEITLDTSDATSWLDYSPSNTTLHGQVPNETDSEPQALSLVVTEDDTQVTYPVNIVVLAATRPTTSTTISATTSPESSATGVEGSSEADTNPNAQPQRILAIVLTSVFTVMAVILIILFCLCWRRRREKKLSEKEEPKDVPPISARNGRSTSLSRAPVSVAEGGGLAAAASAKGRTSESGRKRTPIKSPQIGLPWAPDSFKKARMRFTQKSHAEINDSFDSNWSGFVKGHGHQPKSQTTTGTAGSADLTPVQFGVASPVPLYTGGRRRSEAERKQSSRLAQIQRERLEREPLSNHRTQALSVARRSPGLPDHPHIGAGVGHGAAILSPTTSAANAPWHHSRMPTRSSWATTSESANDKENRHSSMTSTNFKNFPLPPSATGQYDTLQDEQDPHDTDSSYAAGMTYTKPSLGQSGMMPVLRLVSPSSSESHEIEYTSERESFSSRLQNYHADRARADVEVFSHFSNGGTRTPSFSRFLPGTTAYRGPSSTFGRHLSGPGRTSFSRQNGHGPSTREIPSSPPRPLTRGGGSGNWSKWPLTSDAKSSMGRNLSIVAPRPRRPPTGPSLTRAVSASSGQFSSAMSSSGDSQWEDEEAQISVAMVARSPPMTGGDWGYGYGYQGMSARDATDEMLFELGVDERGDRQWTTTSSSAANSAVVSPRLPFGDGKETMGDEGTTDMGAGSEGVVGEVASSTRTSATGVGGMRLSDRRQRIVSVDGKSGEGLAEGSNQVRRSESKGGGKGIGKAAAWGGRERSRRGSLRFI